MWKGKTVSVVFPTYNERASIVQAIEDSFATGLVDEVVVVNNNAITGTAELVAATRARQVFESRQGYGWALRRGLEEATGDLLILSEPDGTFSSSDYLKLLVYHDDGHEVVLGTRTTKGFIWDGANMGFLLKTGNVLLAKVVEVLFLSRCQLTDVGCTLRLLSRPAYERIRSCFRVGGSHFGLEMTVLSLHQGLQYCEVPVNYLPRVGTSSVTGSLPRTVLLALQMGAYLVRYRLGSFFRAGGT